MHPILTAQWWGAAGIRALKTFAQTVVAVIGTDLVGILDVEWVGIASVAAVAAITSLLTSLAGLPELDPLEPGDGRYRAEG